MEFGLFLFICQILHVMRGILASQCWQGATFSESTISLDLKSSSILRIPDITTLAQCSEACCDVPGCDLAWLFERQCYILSCRHEADCLPKQRRGADSYLAFPRRGGPLSPPRTLVVQSLVRGEHFPPSGRRWSPDQGTSSHHRGLQDSLQDLALLQGEEDLDEGGPGLDYPENYRGALEEEEDEEDKEDEQVDRDGALNGESSNRRLSEMLFQTEHHGSSETLNLTEAEDGTDRQQLTQLPLLNISLAQPSASPLARHGSGSSPPDTQITLGPAVSAPVDPNAAENLNNTSSITEATAFLLNATSNVLQSNQTRISATPISLFPPIGLSPQPLSADSVRTLAVSIMGPSEVTLPLRSLELTGLASPAPQSEGSYKYAWSWVSTPEDHKAVIQGEDSKSVQITRLIPGLYGLRVAVSGDHSYGEGTINFTVHPEHVNHPPKAVVYPPTQDLTFPVDVVSVNGSGSTDMDDDIISYHWEQVSGPLLGNGSSMETPVLHLHTLLPGEYTFKLTVTDAQGLADSSTASVNVANQQQDDPPVADAGPNKVVMLPLDRLVLWGNGSTDDQGIDSYLWSLHPSSQNREVTMQGVREPFLQLSGLMAGEYTFQLTITDSIGQEDSSSVTVSVIPENAAPVAVVGPDRQLILPVNSITLDGSSSTDDRGISSFHWDNLSGPPGARILDPDKAVTTATGLRAGSHRFLLTVRDQQGLSNTASFTVYVKEARNLPLVAHASGSHTLTLPTNALVLRGSVSNAGPANVSFLWVRDEQSPAAGDILYSSEYTASLYLANLVEGTYLFQLRVSDALGRSSSATATVEVRPDPREREEVELELEVGVAQVSQQQKNTVLRQLAALLHVLDADIALKGLHGQSDISTTMRFSVQGLNGTIPGPRLAKMLRGQLLRQRTDFLLFKVLRVDTVMCLLHCSGRGQCDPVTKSCSCDPLWIENPFQRFLEDGESNCEWNVLYVVLSGFLGVVLILSVSWTCFCCCKRTRRTKVRKKTKYTILDNMDEQERMELRPKYHIKHRSTEHNSCLMMSESEFDSDQDTVFSNERSDRPRNRANGSTRNGDAFSFHSVDS